MDEPQNRPEAHGGVGFFAAIADPQSYRNIAYLLLGLPLGTLYFTVLVTGISVGVSLMVVALVGIPILIGLWFVVRGFMSLERNLAIALLDVEIAPLAPAPDATGGLWNRFKAMVRDRPTWIGVWYLLLRFPAGIATFTVAVTLISTSVGLTFAPVYMWTSNDLTWGPWTFDPFPWSFALVPIGVALAFVSLFAMNLLADACGRWTRVSLGRTAPDGPRVDLDELEPLATASR